MIPIRLFSMHAAVKSSVVAIMLALLAATACERKPAYGWHTLEAREGAFSVSLPGVATEEDKPMKSATGGSFTSHSYNVKASKEAAYGCSWWEDPTFKDRTAEQILDNARESGLSGVNGRLLSEKQLTVQGHPARDIRAVARGKAAYDNRLVLVGNRLYTLLVLDVSGKHDDKNVEKFFNSLVLR
jgi:hypothetical protein